MESAQYPVTDRSRVRLFAARGTNEKKAIHEVIDSALYGVVSYVVEGQPFATPTMVWRQDDHLYWPRPGPVARAARPRVRMHLRCLVGRRLHCARSE